MSRSRDLWLGLFAHVLHIRPWELEELSVRDFRRLVAWLEEYNRKDDEE